MDINAAYGSKVRVDQMNNGTVYLNEKGSVTSALSATNTVEATLISDSALINSMHAAPVAGYSVSDTSENGLYTVTRTLLSGDFSAWTSDDIASQVKLTYDAAHALDVQVSATSEGLFVTYKAPEPATATLSLLALAALAARCKRH